MIAVVSLTSLASGTVVACCSERLPGSAERNEMIAALLFVLGLVVVGAALTVCR